MLKSEFEKLAGIEVSDEYYRLIETVYIALKMDKAEFCKVWKGISAPDIYIIEELASRIKSLESEDLHYKDGSVKAGKKLLAVADTIPVERDGRNVVAVDGTVIDIAVLLKDTSRLLLTDKAYTRECLEKGYGLSDFDRQYLLKLMDNE